MTLRDMENEVLYVALEQSFVGKLVGYNMADIVDLEQEVEEEKKRKEDLTLQLLIGEVDVVVDHFLEQFVSLLVQ